MMPDVIVVGAGIAGLSCAWTLSRSGLKVLVLEKSPHVGGVIQSHKINGYLVEAGPNTALPTPNWTSMVLEMGLGDELLEAPSRSPRFIYVDGRLRKVPFSVLSKAGLLRAAAEPFIPQRSISDESLASFFKRRFGEQVHERLAAPFVTGIYAGDTEKLSLGATFPKMMELENRYGSVIIGMLRSYRSGARPRLSSFIDGMAALPSRLAEELNVQCNVGDLSLAADLTVEWGTDSVCPKAIVLAVPSYAASSLTRLFSSDLAHLLGMVEYAPMVAVAMSVNKKPLGKQLDGFGFLIPRTEGLHTLGTLFSSSLFPFRAPDGRALLTSFVGGALQPEVLDWTDDRIRDTVSSELKKVLTLPVDPELVTLFRWRNGIPQYQLGHRKWVESVSSAVGAIPGLYLTGNYIDEVSVPGSMERGQTTALEVIDYIRRKA